MKPYRHGIFVGKFYPFHLGHLKVIQDAMKQCEVVTVILIDSVAFNKPSAATRENWIRASLREGFTSISEYAAIQVVTIPDLPGVDNSQEWAMHTRGFITQPIDVVFSSEWYGIAYAEALGAEHVMVDFSRTNVPISGTKIRENPLEHLQYMPPIVRAHFVKKVAIMGAESTGKTTLALALGKHYQTSVALEYGRLYAECKLEDKYGEWSSAEFTHIAIQQSMLENQLAQRANRILICDTNPYATAIWHKRYMGMESQPVKMIAQNRQYDLVFLAGDDIPFTQDGTRDGEHIRHDMQDWFRLSLQQDGIPYIELIGCKEDRLSLAISAIDTIVSFK